MIRTIFIFLVVYMSAIYSMAQDESDDLEKILENRAEKLDDLYGVDKLILLNQLVADYLVLNPRRSIKYGKQAVELAENLIPESKDSSSKEQFFLKIDAYIQLGKAHYTKEHYYDARVSFLSAKAYASGPKYRDRLDTAELYLEKLDSIGVKPSFLKEKLTELKLGQTIKSESQDLALSSSLKTAETYEKNGNYEKAIRNYEKAINYLKDKGEEEQIAELYRRIAELYDKAGNISKSVEYYRLAIDEKEKLGDTTGLDASKEGLNVIREQIDELSKTEGSSADSAVKMVELQTREDYRNMAAELEANEDYEQSLQYYKLYNELNDKIIEDEKHQQLVLLEKSHEIERNLQEIQLLTQDKEIQELELEKKESEILDQSRFRNNLIVGIVLLLALAAAIYWLYVIKRRAHKRLNLAHDDLQLTQGKLISAEKKIKTLLSQQLSSDVANALISEDVEGKIQRKLVCIMFLDIRGFTTFAESRKPEEIISFQNEVFGFMIDSVYKHHGIINQFLGDGFMATFGAPVSTGNDSENALLAAREIIRKVNDKSASGEIPSTRVGVGLHTGKVVVGNVGTSVRKQYSITGNAVIIAARIEQLNKKFGSQLLLSKEVLKKLKNDSEDFDSLGEVQLKGMAKALEIYKVL